MASELERAEQRRRNLTADVAHELRTPLQIIQGNLEGVLDGLYTPDPAHLRATLEETRILSRLVSDLQTLSLAESGQLPLHPLKVSAADLVADAVTSFSGQANEAGIDLLSEIQSDRESLECTVDPDRMDQVLSNLIVNAIRHTPQGGKIVLRAAAKPDRVRLEVEDSGTGIPPEDLPFVFDRFYRGDRSRSRQPGTGSGLGLAIARQLVEAQGGKIMVESQLGSWTKFTLDLYSSPQIP
jgi:two-component system OmpR family sensor kinase/two-component system sensor histidine kinase BaeS